jgi:hypothetical protein
MVELASRDIEPPADPSAPGAPYFFYLTTLLLFLDLVAVVPAGNVESPVSLAAILALADAFA